MWPIYIFFGVAGLMVLEFLWQNWRNKKHRAKAQQEYTAALLKQQQEANAQAQAQQHALFNSMVEGVLLLDEQERIILVNESLRKFFRLPAEVRGEAVDVFQWPELTALLERLKKEKSIPGFAVDLAADKTFHLQINSTVVLDKGGGQQGYLFVFHDLTRQKELESLRQEFVGNVSHELRTPLSLIKGFTETLLTGAKDDPGVATRFLHKIDNHADRLLYLIEDLLTISRLESGRVALNSEELSLREIIDRVFEDVHARASERQVTLENHVAATTTAWGDADRLQQVFFNLVENAIKYGGDGGRIVVGEVATGNDTVELFVQDNGCGIPAESLDRIFERFYRVDRARSRETGGTGLGLAIVKHIVQAHGGEVRVKSEVNRGSTFFLTLPKRCP